MLEAADQVVEFTGGMDASSFAADRKTAWATIRGLEIIGAAAKFVPPVVRQRFPELPWSQMAGMRDTLTPDYFGVNIDVVWLTIQNNLPDLRSRLRVVVAVLEREETTN